MAQDPDTPEVDVEEDYENIWLRLVHMVIIALLMSMASTLLGVMTVAQFLIMAFNKRQPNEQLAEIGTRPPAHRFWRRCWRQSWRGLPVGAHASGARWRRPRSRL